jgi:prepilin-type N-terminal cleavage/methylation domain-containing protein
MQRQGFSLLELSIVLTVIAIVVAGSLSVGGARISQDEVKNTYDEMLVIRDAIRVFTKVNSRMPCPASLSAIPGNANYGKELRNVGDTDCATAAADVTYRLEDVNSSDWHFIGAVPVYTLGLSDEYLGDSWNGRYLYTVDANLVTGTPMGGAPTGGTLNIIDSAGGNTSTSAAWALVSHSISNRGSYNTRSGIYNMAGCSPTSYPLDSENCDFRGTGAFTGGSSNDATVISTAINNSDTTSTFYDDIVLWMNSASTVIP